MIKFICGRSGRGKTQYLFDDIKQKLASKENKPIYLIVPDQMSFQTEFELLQQQKNGAMMHVEVLGLSRFVTQMIDYLAPTEYTTFDTLAQKMLLQQAALEYQNELKIYQKSVEKPEFIDYLHQFSRQLKGTGMNLQESIPLDVYAQNPILVEKLKEIEHILQLYQTKITDDMFDLADKMQYYLSLLKRNENRQKMQDIHVYIDGYYTFNNLETEVITNTLQTVKTGMISFCLDETEYKQKSSIFHLIYQQFVKINNVVTPDEIVYLDGHKNRFSKNLILDFVEKNYDNPIKIDPVVENTSPISVLAYTTIEQEVILTAQKLRKLLLEENIQAKEVAVYLPKKELYAPLIEKYFKLYDLPYYLDLKDNMLIHPVFQWFYTLLEIVKNNWQIEDILTLLHNDFFRKNHEVADDDYYLFVDFIEQIRFPYKRVWKQDKYWIYYDTPQRLTNSINDDKTKKIQTVRAIIMRAIQEFESLFTKNKVENMNVLESLFEYIQAQPIYEYTINNATHLEHTKYLSHVTEKQYQEMVWKQLIFIFEQTNLAIGEQNFNKATLIQALLLGLENAEFTSVPSGFDAIMVGDFARTRFQTLHQENSDTSMGVQYAFILGVTNKFVPFAEDTINILSNEELLVMRTNNILNDILLQDEAINYQLFRFYTLVTSAAKEVHLSYYQYSGMYLEEENSPSAILESNFINGFKVAFNEVSFRNNVDLHNITLSSAKYLLTQNYLENKWRNTSLYQMVQYLDSNFIKYLDDAQNYKNEVVTSSNIIIPEALSLTQIETYNACPYQYFLKYVLHVDEPQNDKIRALQTGTLLHDAYELLAQQAVTKHIKMNEVEHPEQTIDQFFALQEQQLLTHPLFNQETNKFLYKQTLGVAQQSLEFLMNNEQKSNFIPEHLEYRFPNYPLMINGQTKYLVGKLDRIDFNKEKDYFRIIDYKSSKRTIEFNKLLYGTQLQLPLYSFLASTSLSQTLAGSMYVPIIENNILLDFSDTTNDISKTLQKNYQATGLFLDDIQALENFDTTLKVEAKSLIIPYEQKKDGTANQHSAVLSSDELQQVQEFALDKAKQTLEEIDKRDFEVKPLREDLDYDTTPCKYCPFRSICQFDQKINCYNDKQKNIKEKSFIKKKEKFLEEIIKEKQ